MKCWNCAREIPDDAKACQFCEADASEQPTAEEIQVVGETLDMLDPEMQQALMDVFVKGMSA